MAKGYRRRCVSPPSLVLGAALVAALTVTDARATSELWVSATDDFAFTDGDGGTPDDDASCNGCHRIEPNSAAVGVSGVRIAHDAPSARITPEVESGPGDQVSYTWRYRPRGTDGPGTVVTTEGTRTIAVPGTGDRRFDYCIGAHNDGPIPTSPTAGGASDVHDLRCGSFLVTRAPPPPPPDEPPVILSRTPAGTVQLREDGPSVNVLLRVDDENPRALVYGVIDNAPEVAVTSLGGAVFRFDPVEDGGGTVRLTVTDGAGQQAFVDVPFTVAEAEVENTAPTITGRTPAGTVALTFPGEPVAVTLSVTDADGDPLVYGVSDVDPGVSVIHTTGGVFRFTPLAVATGTVRLTVEDGSETVETEVPFKVSAAASNAPPGVTVTSATSLVLEPGESTPLSYTVSDENVASVEVVVTSSDPAVATVGGVSGSGATVTAVGEGAATLTVTATDDEGLPGSATVTVTVDDDEVEPPEEAPRITGITPPAPLTLQTDGAAATVTVAVEDDDPPDELGFSASGGPPGLEIVHVGGGRFELTPGGTAGEGDVTFTVTDDDAGSATSGPYRVVIETAPPTYVAPRIDGVEPAGPLALEPGESAVVTASVVAGSEAAPEVSASSDDVGVVDVASDGAAGRFRIEARGPGSATVTIAVADSRGVAATLAVAVTVAAPDEPPVAEDDRFVHDAANPVLDVLANDSDPEGGTLEIVLSSSTSERGASLAAEAAGVRYTPATDSLAAEDRFEYRVRDAAGQSSNPATVTVVASDRDGDGVDDATDNCPVSPNPNQSDTDSDGEGDLCDPSPDGEEITETENERGRELVETVCRSCHLVPETGAPQIGDTIEWERRIAERGVDGVVRSAIVGRGAMQAFGGQYSAEELRDATLFMAGRRAGPVEPLDTDVDGVADVDDNCPRVPNPDQLDGDGDGVGDLCEAGVVLDDDEDGYPATLDNDDADARRLPAQAGSSGTGRSGLVESDSRLTLGPVARAVLEALGEGGAVVAESVFDEYAPRVHGVAPTSDVTVASRGQVHDVIARDAPGGAATLRVTLARNLPNDPVLQTYGPSEGRWSTFVPSGANALASAAFFGDACPISTASDNYGEGLFTGLGCLALTVADGGPFDADGATDGAVSFVFRIASERSGPEPPPPPPRSSGGGGASGALALAAGGGFWLARRRRRRPLGAPLAVRLAALLAALLAAMYLAPRARALASTGKGRRSDRRRGTGRRTAAVLASLLLASGRAEALGLTALDLRFVGDSNPAKAEFEDDIEASSSASARLSANLFGGPLSETTQVSRGYSFDVSAGYGHDFDLEGLGESVYRLSGGFFHESKTRALAPFYRFGVGLSWIDSETDIRDGPAIDVSASINLQPTPFFDTTLGAGFESRQAETDVFDTDKARVFLTANFSPAPRIVLRGGLRAIFGDEVSTATPTLGIVNGARTIEPDPAFGGVEDNRFAYLIDATSFLIEAGLGYELTPLIETNLLFRQVRTEAEGDIGYDRSLLELTLSFAFP